MEFQSRTTGLERYDLPYRALPETDLATARTDVRLLGRQLEAPLLIGAMTGGAASSATINRNLALAAQELGLGMMFGSQRIMLEEPEAAASFRVRDLASDVLLLGNLGIAQLNRGYGAEHVRRAIGEVGADGLVFHTNPLQEAVQDDGDTDFRGLVRRLEAIVAAVDAPLLLKEVGHGLDTTTVRAVAEIGLAGIDVAGAGGTSWARVEQYVRHGEILHPELAEWGIPTSDAIVGARRHAPRLTLIASGGIRSGLDVAKAIALGADAAALALPLLRPALESADAVRRVLERVIRELRIAMHCAGAGTVTELRDLPLVARL